MLSSHTNILSTPSTSTFNFVCSASVPAPPSLHLLPLLQFLLQTFCQLPFNSAFFSSTPIKIPSFYFPLLLLTTSYTQLRLNPLRIYIFVYLHLILHSTSSHSNSAPSSFLPIRLFPLLLLLLSTSSISLCTYTYFVYFHPHLLQSSATHHLQRPFSSFR